MTARSKLRGQQKEAANLDPPAFGPGLKQSRESRSLRLGATVVVRVELNSDSESNSHRDGDANLELGPSTVAPWPSACPGRSSCGSVGRGRGGPRITDLLFSVSLGQAGPLRRHW